ncbi:MAG: hypothetical protein ACOC16_00445 [Nanoarchaeota archaeon]
MNLTNRICTNLWKILPASMFNPNSGHPTLEGSFLSYRPSLTQNEAIKFAVFTEPRFYMSHLYKKLIPFVPEEFEVIDKPNGQNCFMYSLGILKPNIRFGREKFYFNLKSRNYQSFNYSKDIVEKGDIIVYSTPGYIDSVIQHAGVYVGNGRVRARWGNNSPLIEHPLKEVISHYWNKDDKYLTVEKKMS